MLSSYKKGKGSFYIAQYPVRWTAQSALHVSSPGRLVHSDTNSASPGSILVRQQLRAKTKSLTFPPTSIARYSFIQLSQQWRQWRERKCPIVETVQKGDSNPGSHDCESGILPLSYRALHILSATALIHRTARPSIPAMSSLFGLSPKCRQFLIMWLRSHVATL